MWTRRTTSGRTSAGATSTDCPGGVDTADYIRSYLGWRYRGLGESVTLTVVYATILLSGVVGNVSTCVVIATNRAMHSHAGATWRVRLNDMCSAARHALAHQLLPAQSRRLRRPHTLPRSVYLHVHRGRNFRPIIEGAVYWSRCRSHRGVTRKASNGLGMERGVPLRGGVSFPADYGLGERRKFSQ